LLARGEFKNLSMPAKRIFNGAVNVKKFGGLSQLNCLHSLTSFDTFGTSLGLDSWSRELDFQEQK